MAKYIYRAINMSTGEIWEEVTTRDIAERLNLSHATVSKYVKNGFVKDFKMERIEKKQNPRRVIPEELIIEWDRYVPKLHEKIVDLGINILVTKGCSNDIYR